MGANKQKNKDLNQLRSDMFELFTTNTNISYSTCMTEASNKVCSFLKADVAVLYQLDEWKGRYHLITDREEMKQKFHETLSLKDFRGTPRQYLFDLTSDEQLSIPKQKEYIQAYQLPLFSDERCLGFMWVGFKEEISLPLSLLDGLALEITRCVNHAVSCYASIEEGQKYELLYNVAAKFHSSIDMDGVLKEIIATLRKIYPEFHYYLLLSQSYTSDSELPVRELTYERDASSKASTHAFLTGEVQIEERKSEMQSFLYAPLKGKQGIYGVLEVAAPSYLYFPQKDIDFFVLISNTAGKALENAKLYMQSRSLIDDLQLINETAHKLNSNMRLTEKISYMASQIKTSFQADEVGFLIFNNENDKQAYSVLDGSSPFFISERAEHLIYEISRMSGKTQEPLFVGDYAAKTGGGECPYQSIMAVPMMAHDQLNGLAVVFKKTPYFFSFDSFKLLQSLVHHSTLAFANSMLREELEKTIITDYLTKLHSRNYLDKCMDKYLEQDELGHFILIDIDNFKKVNDTYGHQVGDAVITQVAQSIKKIVGEQGLAARWGGEELAVYLPSLSIEKAYEMTDYIREEISVVTNPSVTVSCGISSWTAENRPESQRIVQQADDALYTAKGSGKNQIIMAGQAPGSFIF
ncbi:diguanylate cyclase [Halobacillus rhizosphaerae]|uniref:sensor domain-containing diguanylate cyclase n=1 Tax=Halobacillus rhizosphaerae TaxID=3064889 RepID=UPI00398B9AFB